MYVKIKYYQQRKQELFLLIYKFNYKIIQQLFYKILTYLIKTHIYLFSDYQLDFKLKTSKYYLCQILIMLKPQHKRHSQTLNTRKPKPIQITLTKKINHLFNQTQPNVTCTNQTKLSTPLNSISPSIQFKSSTIQVLKQKNFNSNTSNVTHNNKDFRSLKNNEQKLKKQVCPEYKINWADKQNNQSINICENNKQSNRSIFYKSQKQQNNQKEFGYMMRTVDYKKIAKQAQQMYLKEHQQHNNTQNKNLLQKNNELIHIQSFQNFKKIQSNPHTKSRQRSISTSQGVIKKIKGITKSYLRDYNTKQLSNRIPQFDDFSQRNYQQKQSSLLFQQRLCTLPIQAPNFQQTSSLNQNNNIYSQILYRQSEDVGIQNVNIKHVLQREVQSLQINQVCTFSDSFMEGNNFRITHQNSSKLGVQFNVKPSIQVKSQNDSNFQGNNPKISTYKQQIAHLSQRLQNCVQQIDFIQKNNSIQKIVQLESQIQSLKQEKQSQKAKYKIQIQELQQKIIQKQMMQVLQNKSCSKESTQTQTDFVMQRSIQPFQSEKQTFLQQKDRQIEQLRLKVSFLNQKLNDFTASNHLSSSVQQQTKRSSIFTAIQARQLIDLQNKQYELQIQKKKYQTLQQILQTKRNQIVNKDSIIAILMNKEAEKIAKANGKMVNDQERKEKLKKVVSGFVKQLEIKIMEI